MKANFLFLEKENQEICTACCRIFVFPFVNYISKEELLEISLLIIKNDWQKLFKNEVWLKFLNTILTEDMSLAGYSINIFFKHFKEEMEIISAKIEKHNQNLRAALFLK